MSDKTKQANERRSVLGGLGAAALAGVALGSSRASAQQPAGFTPKRHALDAWMDELGGDHRVFIDTDNAAGGTNAARYATNILNAHVNAYGGSDDEMAMILCYRHASTPFGFNDAMWEKYGATLATMSRIPVEEGETPIKNPQTAAIAGLVERGVHFAICNSATTMMSGFIARAAGMTQEAVYADLVANTIPNGHMVPAGVMALTRAQEHGYSLLYSSAA